MYRTALSILAATLASSTALAQPVPQANVPPAQTPSPPPAENPPRPEGPLPQPAPDAETDPSDTSTPSPAPAENPPRQEGPLPQPAPEAEADPSDTSEPSAQNPADAADAASPNALPPEGAGNAPSTTPLPSGEYTAAEIDSYAKATVKAQAINSDTSLDAQSKQAAMVAAVQESGLQPARYNAISAALGTDPTLRAQVEAALAKERATTAQPGPAVDETADQEEATSPR